MAVRNSIAITSIGFALLGCASEQLNLNTMEIANGYDLLITSQVAYNILKTFSDPNRLPAIVKINTGTAQTTNTITPSLSLPLSSARAVTLASSASRTSTLAGEGLTLGGTNSWNQSYTLTPVTDPDQMRRIRTLNQFVTSTIQLDPVEGLSTDDLFNFSFEVRYPLIEASVSTSSATTSSSETKLSVMVGTTPVTVVTGASPPRSTPPKTIYVRRVLGSFPDGKYHYAFVQVNPDTTFIKTPGCVLCDYGSGLSSSDLVNIKAINPQLYKTVQSSKNVHRLEKNRLLRRDWLYYPNESVQADAIAIPANSEGALYVKGQLGSQYFYEFALMVQDASLQGTGSPASGGQSDGRKTLPVQTFSLPAGTLAQ